MGKKLSIIIPFYNEQEGIKQLKEKLVPTTDRLKRSYDIEILLIDDGSTDKTNELLHKYFDNMQGAKIIVHEKNMNLGAAHRTGFSQATGDFIAFLDSDCTYDPNLIEKMLSLFDENTDIVTVSPYHPRGRIENVPRYRMFLSKSVSMIYRMLSPIKLYTYTAMVRVYRNRIPESVHFRSNNFLAVTEIMIRAAFLGFKAKEIPAVLHGRQFGVSKLKTMRVMRDHLSLLRDILLYKLVGRSL